MKRASTRLAFRASVILFAALAAAFGLPIGSEQAAALSSVPGDSGSAPIERLHEPFTEVLSRYVHDGKVDYPGLCSDGRFAEYLSRLSSTDPSAIADRDERLAFWLNAYNAFTIKLICDNYPVASIKDLRFARVVKGSTQNQDAWNMRFITIGGVHYTLNEIEHSIIGPEFKDPRVHFALVCAAVSCPPLRPEAYEGARLDEQLNDQGRIFLSDTSKNFFDRENKIAYLSKIFSWYAGDFGQSRRQIMVALLPFLPKDLAADIRGNPGAWDIQYTAYDWGLND